MNISRATGMLFFLLFAVFAKSQTADTSVTGHAGTRSIAADSIPPAADSLSAIRLVTLHPLVGERIDSTEKIKYHLFPYWKKEDYSSAYITEEPGSGYKITGLMKDGSTKTIPVTAADIKNMHFLVSYYGGLIKEDNSDLVELGLRVVFDIIDMSTK